NSNKFVNRLKSMNRIFKDEYELIKYIEERLVSDANTQPNSATRIPPTALLKKEKEYLGPLPNNVLMESYLQEHKRTKIDSTLLFYWKKSRYSVPASCLNKFVDVYQIEDSIYVYQNKQLVTKHNISQCPVNYHKEHYIEGLSSNVKTGTNIEKMAEENLKRLKGL
ncbi:MAG: IS21 family transposase, partial [Bacillota bacterium]|nr:IS21 family transposase [Bacillota bacterium]